MKFIEKINFTADLQQMINDLNLFISRNPWPNTTFMHNNQKYHANQLGLTYRPNADYPLGDAGGSLYDPVTNSFTSSDGEAVNDNELSAKCYNIPADGSFYRVDTTKEHFVYNGGWEPRIHLVICSA